MTIRLLSYGFVLALLFPNSPSLAGEINFKEVLSRRVINADLPLKEVREFCEARLTPVPEFKSAAGWQKYADALRNDVLDKVVFRGEAAKWRQQKTKAEWLDTIEGGPGYKIRKLRYEVVPGMWCPALLYEPTKLIGKAPVVLNVNGHDRGNGKAAKYKQIRCINQAKRGMIALNVEWLGMGQLNTPGFAHYKMNQLDLCGTSGIAPFFLQMSRGIDILLDHKHADASRVAVAGLSGGGWQTIFISSLDTRVTLCNPVAGYSSFRTRSRFTSDLGDSEQTPTDLGMVADYAQLTALLAPRPVLLTNNANDQCCFKAEHALPPLVEAAMPAYRLLGMPQNLRTHVNHDPGSHNFDRDNREQLYRMLGDHFFGGLQDVVLSIDRDKLKAYALSIDHIRKAIDVTSDTKSKPIKSRINFRVSVSLLDNEDALDALSHRIIHRREDAPPVRLRDIADIHAVQGTQPFHNNYKVQEIASDDEIKSKEELFVEIREGNQDFNSVAIRLSKQGVSTNASPSDADELANWRTEHRARLKKVINAKNYTVQAIPEFATSYDNATATWWWLRCGGEWTVPAVEIISNGAADRDLPPAIVMADAARASSVELVAKLVGQGRRVIAIDPFFFGESKISSHDFLYALLVATVGERALGIQASQVAATARWAQKQFGQGPVDVFTVGPRSSLFGRVAAAIETDAIHGLTTQDELKSLKDLIANNVGVNQQPEAFCFGLLPAFDVDQLKLLAKP